MLVRSRIATVLAVGALGACGGDAAGDTATFCADLQTNLAAITQPDLATEDDIDAHVDLYRQLASEAPLAIDEHVDALVLGLETVATVVIGDQESEQVAARRMFASEKSALAIDEWTSTNCGFDIGPVATIGPAPPTTVATTATLVAG